MKFKGKKAAELRSIVAELKTKIDAKMGELKDGLSAEDTRKIQSDHDALVADFEDASRALEAAEKEEGAADARTRAAESGNDAGAADERASRAAQQAVEVERKRIASLADTGKRHGLADEFVADHIRKGTPEADFNAAVLAELVRVQEAQGGPKGGAHNRGVESVGQDETVTRRDAMVEYIMARQNVGQMTERAAALFRGMTAIDLVREALSWKGEATRGLLPDEIAQRGLHSTSDFPNILANVANKTLRAAYAAAPRTFLPWTRQLRLSDFKTYNILRRGETPQLALVNESGEFKRGTLTESKETIALKTYGVVVGLTRQAIINDDLGALVGIPSDFATSAASLESDLVYGKLLANGLLNQDSTALFDETTHKNLAGSGTALDITPLAVMRSNMAKQTGLDGKTVLNIMASFLLVPPELETRADQLMAPLVAVENAKNTPQWIRSLTPISEARLSVGVSNSGAGVVAGGSGTAYYLASNQVDTIIWATLDGRDGPYVESRIGFDVDGVEIKCRHDFGAAVADFRGLQKNPGAS